MKGKMFFSRSVANMSSNQTNTRQLSDFSAVHAAEIAHLDELLEKYEDDCICFQRLAVCILSCSCNTNSQTTPVSK